MTISAHIHSLFNFLKRHLFQLNLFNTGTEDENIIRNEQRSTRLYLCFLIVPLVIFVTYYSVISYTSTIIIQSPTIDKYSQLIQESSLECPCSNVSITYEKFIHIEPHYHEVCESNFVSNEWMDRLFSLYEQSWNKSIPSDFRRIGFFQFKTIRSLCQLAKDTIEGDLQAFNYTDFIQSKLISQESFEDQINSYIKNFIEVTPKTFSRTLRFVQDTTAESLFMVGGSLTSVQPIPQYRLRAQKRGIIAYPGINYTFKDGSTCVCSSSTATSCMGLTTFMNDIIPGFQTGCYMLSALMNSTLEAFYNQTIIDKISNSSDDFRKLNSSNSNDTVGILINQMFVKFWSNSTSYEKYFQSCSPDSCQFKRNQHNNIWAIILLLIGLFGGLSSALKIITPILIVNIWPFIWKTIFRRCRYTAHMVTVEPTPVTSMGMRLKMSYQLVKRKLLELNLFKSFPRSQDETVLQEQRHHTRIYLVLLLASFFILTLFTSIRSYTITTTVSSPSLTNVTQLYEQYSRTFDCPCNQATVEYNEFIDYIKVEYHEICVSEFITSRWIDLQFIKASTTTIFFINDIRYQSEIHFKLLSTLCRIANQTIEESLQLFYQTKLLTNQVLTSSSFQIQVNLIVDQFKRTITESYQRTLQLILANSEINQFIVPLNSEFALTDYTKKYFEGVKSPLDFESSDQPCLSHTICYCDKLSTNECVRKTIINENEIINISGMYHSTFPLQSVLISTLECFYNDICLSQITQLVDSTLSPTNFSTLVLSINDSEYNKIHNLANELFIQSWSNQSSYERYFNRCHPITCQYDHQNQLNIIYVLTTVIGLLGGINIALRLLVPHIVKLARQTYKRMICRQRNNAVPTVGAAVIKPTFRDRLRRSTGLVKKKVFELNLFPTISQSQDKNITCQGRRMTRIYLVLVFLSIFILAVYTTLTQQTVITIVQLPTISTYSKLYNQYSQALQCSCSRIAVKYNKFITQIEPKYHSVCSSTFVASNWSDALNVMPNSRYLEILNDDFRRYSKTLFETLSKMCSLSQEILSLSLPIWLQTDFITTDIISSNEFEIRIDGLIEEFKRKTINQFVQTFKLIQVTNHANQLATAQLSNWKFVGNFVKPFNAFTDLYSMLDSKDEPKTLHVLALPQTYEENHCSCALQSNCSTFYSFPHRTSNQSLKQILPGFRIGCFPFDALFQSTFSCLYNQTCLDVMQAAIYYSKPIPAKILIDTSLSSSNTTVETFLNQLFVIKWSKNVSFEHYFNSCAPEFCQYSYRSKFNRIYFLATIVALFGGLTDGLHFLISCVLIVLIKLYEHRKKNQVTPQLQQSNTAAVEFDDKTVEVAPITPITTTDVIIPSIQQETQPVKHHKERAITICLSLLVIVAITVISTVWLKSSNTKYYVLTTTGTTTTTTMITPITITSNICYMNLVHQSVSYPIGLGGKSLIVDDFNKDSFQDLAVTNYDDHTISVLFGNGNGTFQIQQIYSTDNGTFPWGITIGYFNDDTFLDIAVTLSVPNEIAIFYGIPLNSSFTTTLPHTFTVGDDIDDVLNAISASDLNNDGFTDWVAGSYYGEMKSFDYLYIVFNLGNGLRDQVRYRSNANLRDIDSIVTGDFDNDGRKDISACNLEGEVIVLFSLNYTQNSILDSKMKRYLMYEKAHSIIRGRFNDDELDDLALVSSQSDTLQVLLAYGDADFTQQIYSTSRYPTSVARINFNNDSIDDLAVLTCNQTVSIYIGTNYGIFHQNEISFHTDENNSTECVHSLKAADFNQDGKDDLAYIDSEAQTVRIVLGANCDEHI